MRPDLVAERLLEMDSDDPVTVLSSAGYQWCPAGSEFNRGTGARFFFCYFNREAKEAKGSVRMDRDGICSTLRYSPDPTHGFAVFESLGQAVKYLEEIK